MKKKDGAPKRGARKYSSAYNKALESEARNIPELIYKLCQTIKETNRSGPGRPPYSLRDQTFCLLLRAFKCLSTRRFRGHLQIEEIRKYLREVPNYSAINTYLRDEKFNSILDELIGRSVQSLINVEIGFAVDGTHLSLRKRLTYKNTFTADKAKGREYVMLYILCGIESHIIPAAAVSVSKGKYFGHPSENRFFKPLLSKTVQRGFKVKAIWGDNLYDTRANKKYADEIGADWYVTPKPRKKKRGKKQSPEEMPDRIRNSIESTNSMLKGVLGNELREDAKASLINQTLCKIIVHNLRALNEYSSIYGLEIKFGQND